MEKRQLEAYRDKNPFVSLNDVLYELLLEDIISFRFAPGERINESMIADSMDVSRTPVRKALQRLSESGYITVKNNRCYVSAFSRSEYLNVMDLAVMLEAYAAGEAAMKATQQDLAELYSIAKKLQVLYHRAVIREGGMKFKELLFADMQFHRRIVQISGNTLVAEVYDKLIAKIFRYRSYLLYSPPEGLFKILENDHVIICDSLALGDRETASATAKRHLRISETVYEKSGLLEKMSH